MSREIKSAALRNQHRNCVSLSTKPAHTLFSFFYVVRGLLWLADYIMLLCSWMWTTWYDKKKHFLLTAKRCAIAIKRNGITCLTLMGRHMRSFRYDISPDTLIFRTSINAPSSYLQFFHLKMESCERLEEKITSQLLLLALNYKKFPSHVLKSEAFKKIFAW